MRSVEELSTLQRSPQGVSDAAANSPSVRIVQDDDVAARLRSVLAATTPGVRDQAATATPGRARPSGSAVTTRYVSELGGLSAGRDPLRWSDIIPAWPDDVDLEPLPGAAIEIPPEAAAGGARLVAGGVAELSPGDTDQASTFRPGTPWAAPPASIERASEPLPTHLGEHRDEADPSRAPRGPDGGPAAHRYPVPPPAWELPERQGVPPGAGSGWRTEPEWPERERTEPEWPERETTEPEWPDRERTEPEHDDDPPLRSVGAFGGPAGGGRGAWIGAFDPGRRGVRVLAVVAALVVVTAAVLAWRARPRVDPVAPPSFGTSASTGAPAAPAEPIRRVASSGAAELVVAVGGKVRKPGLVRLPPGARVADALTAAGGPQAGTDVALLNLARKVVDGELIMVGVTPPPGAVATGPAGGPPAAGPAGGPVNLNTATPAQLDALPGVGPVLAQRILDAREAQGGFTAVSDLRKVDGIGDARYEQLKDLVTV
jgi:comEA protein